MKTNLFCWAHRGASCEAPENTLVAFMRAVELGANGIELDVHLSQDGIPVVIHDESLERTTDGTGLVTEWTSEALRQMDAGGWFSDNFAGESIPVLSEVLQIFSAHTRVNIEIKDIRAGEAVLALLTSFPQADVVVSSFNLSLLKTMRNAAPDLPLAVLLDRGNWRPAVALAQQIAAVAVHPNVGLVSRPLVAACRARNLPVHVWTVDDPGQARSLARMGVHGIFTNDPARFKVEFLSF